MSGAELQHHAVLNVKAHVKAAPLLVPGNVDIDGDVGSVEGLPVGGHDPVESGGAGAGAGGPELRNSTVHHPAPRFAPVEVLRRDHARAPQHRHLGDILNPV